MAWALNPDKFISARFSMAELEFNDGSRQTAVFEWRQSWDYAGSKLVVGIGDRILEDTYIRHLFELEKELRVLRFRHDVPATIHDKPSVMTLEERILRDPSCVTDLLWEFTATSSELQYSTVEENEYFYNALYDIKELGREHSVSAVKICNACNYSFMAYPGQGDDRDELRCYRNHPEAMAEIHSRAKFTSPETWVSGNYFVHAFHSCPYWTAKNAD